MKTSKLKLATGIFQLIYSIPVIGLIYITNQILPIVLLLLHSAAIVYAVKEQRKKAGNLFGIMVSLLSLFVSIDYNASGRHFTLKSYLMLALSWPLSIISTFLIFKERAHSKQQDFLVLKQREKQIRNELQLQQEKLRFEQTANRLINYHSNQFGISIDTNILLDPFGSVLIYSLREKTRIHINVSRIVFDELDGLKKSKDKNRWLPAQQAFQLIKTYHIRNQINLIPAPDKEFLLKYGLMPSNKDDLIVGSYLYLQKQQNRKIAFLSNDRGSRILAREVGLEVID